MADHSLIRELVTQVAENCEHPEPTLPTGLSKLDEFLDGGLRGGEVFVLAARPRVGKSAFALQLALHTAMAGRGVCIWSLEMRPKQWVRRAVAALSSVSPKKIRRGIDWLNSAEMEAITVAMDAIEELPIYFADTSQPFELEADLAKDADCSLLVVDYLQLMEPPAKAHSRENEVAMLSRTMKRTANDLEVPILLVAQLNRNAEGKVPTLADLRESGAVEQDADEVFFLHRDADPDTHVLQDHGLGILAKNRDGESGVVRLRYDWRTYRFEQDETSWAKPKRERVPA